MGNDENSNSYTDVHKCTVWYKGGASFLLARRNVSYKRLSKSKASYIIHQSLHFIEISNHPYSPWPLLFSFSVSVPHFSFLSQTIQFFKPCITLSSFAAWFVQLLWHFISNCPLSWIHCSSVMPLSRGLHIHSKTMFRNISFCAFLSSILTWSLLHALLSLHVAVLRTPPRTLSLSGCPDADSNWLKAICL